MLIPLCLSVGQDLFKSSNQKHILAITRRHGSLDPEEETDGKVLKGHITTCSLDVNENWEFPNSLTNFTKLQSTNLCPVCACLPVRQSGEQSQISWAYSPKVVRTNKITRLVIIT